MYEVMKEKCTYNFIIETHTLGSRYFLFVEGKCKKKNESVKYVDYTNLN
jgi:hypothetical protein